MADEKLLHTEDVIFNKPSLKELIRLIKNGTINAIWPSTKKEFNAWNDPNNPLGYMAYVDESKDRTPERLKLKSLNTSMTIYYGDNDDTVSTLDLDDEKTEAKYQQFMKTIDDEKANLVNLNYYDTASDIYPNDKKLILSLNEENGQINNLQNFINYKDTILDRYKEYREKIKDFINRINNFSPDIEKTSIVLSDKELIKDYNNFFVNTTDEINEEFKKINIPKINAEEDVKKTVIDSNTQIYYFENISKLYETDNNTLDLIKRYISSYYGEDFFTIDNTYQLQLTNLSQQYQLSQMQLDNKIEEYFDLWATKFNEAIQLISDIRMPYIFFEMIKEEDKQKYNDNIETLYSEYIYPYKNLIMYSYAIKNAEKNTTNGNKYYSELIAELKTNVNNLGETATFDDKAALINSSFITSVNSYLMSLRNTVYNLSEKPIIFLSTGEILDIDIIKENIDVIYQLIRHSELVLEQYSTNNILDYAEFLTKKANINADFNKILKTNSDGLTQLKVDQNNVITLYNNLKTEYNKFLQKLQALNIVSIPASEFSITTYGISNIDEICKTITNQRDKLLNHYSVLNNVLKLDVADLIKNLNTESKDLIDRINETGIEASGIGNEQDFIDQVIKPDQSLNSYTMSTINLLLKRITNNYLSFSEEDIIPQVSQDFLTIQNKDIVLQNLYLILDKEESISREFVLSNQIDSINSLLNSWMPIYLSEPYTHYICIAVGSDIQFPAPNKTNANKTAMTGSKIDGTISVLIDNQFYHYPQINNLADTITENTRNTQVLTVGGLASLFGGSGKLTNRNVGNTYTPMYISKGVFTPCAGVVSGDYITTKKGNVTYWRVNHTSAGQVGLQATKLFGAVYNDYAEYRSAEAEPGRCIIEKGDGTLSLSTGRLQLGANIVSDTYGFAIGETNDATCPIAVCGRVLVYPLEAKELFTPGAAVCSGPDGTISLMTREEIKEWPDAIVGYVSEIPTYDTWGTDDVPVNGRIWIKIK